MKTLTLAVFLVFQSVVLFAACTGNGASDYCNFIKTVYAGKVSAVEARFANPGCVSYVYVNSSFGAILRNRSYRNDAIEFGNELRDAAAYASKSKSCIVIVYSGNRKIMEISLESLF